MLRRHSRATLPDTLFPSTALFRSGRGVDGDLDAVADGFDRDDPADRIDMAGDDMPAKLVADLERAFEIQAAADVPHPGRGARDRFGARVDREPARGAVAARIDPLVDHGQARSEEHTSELQSLMRI